MASTTENLGSNPNKSQNIRSVLCATCLSINRVLHPVAALRALVPLLNDVGLDMKDSICWECRALLDKFDKFKNQAKISNSTLNSLVGNNNIHLSDIYSQVCSLSTLKQSTKNKFDAEFSFHIKEENIEYGDNEPSDTIISSLHTCIDIDPWHVKEEVYLCPSLQQEILPVENSNKKLLDTLVPTPVPSAGSKVTLLGSQEIPSQLPRTSIEANISGSSSASEDNVDNDEARRMSNSNKCKKQSIAFINTDLFTNILKGDLMLNCMEEAREQTRINNAKFHDGSGSSAKSESRDIDCSVEFGRQGHLHYQRKSANSEQPRCVKCIKCGKTFVNPSSLNRHMRNTCHKHKGVIPEVQCDICLKNYHGSWGKHMRTHDDTHGGNAYCAKCDIQFKNIYHYQAHLKSNSKHVDRDTFKFQCSYCGKKFYCNTYLSNHIQAVHLKLKDKECEHCNQMFHNLEQLRRHQRENHSGKVKTKNNICHLCGKAFSAKKSLNEHMNTHLGKRPFECADCDATFAYSAALYNHIRLLHLKLKRGNKNSAATVEQS